MGRQLLLWLRLLLTQVLRQKRVDWEVWLLDTRVGELGLANDRVFLELVRVALDNLFAHNRRNPIFLATLLRHLV